MTRKTRTVDGERARRRWSEAEARRQLEELARTTESAVGFARRKGVSTQRLAYWKKRLAAASTSADVKPAFVAVTMPEAASSRREIEIRVADVAVVVQEGCDVEHVAHLVEAIVRRTRAC